ncbi:hypothetical protein L6164_001274 [Bauhinia variegata]|uniref:Uncharacterized protein n=1 Tax=Bauhinia variegata TaxID=167791 RepID=A0ACB9QB84_BAUVA|nr:hypothetical protein L6164_001274 [Bauhinia variegata]
MEINPALHCKCRIMEISHYDGASAAGGGGRSYSDWRDVEDDCPHFLKINSSGVKNPTVLEDTIYWVTQKDLIVSFNVHDETFGPLIVPNQGNRSLESDRVLLIDLQGKLGFVLPSRSDECFSMVIWRLEDSVWE